MTDPTSTHYDLNNALLFEIRRAMGLPQTRSVEVVLNSLLGNTTRKCARLLLELDHQVELNGSAGGARWLLAHFVREHKAAGVELIPRDGPLLIVSNHPASYDGMLIASYVNRPDFKVIIGKIPPYEYLAHVSDHAIFSPPAANTFGRMQTVRHAIQHLKDGGSLLIFLRGGIEPDPAWMPGSDGEFDKWSRSIEIFLQRVPQTGVLVTIVSGVIAQTAMRHPITWFRKARPDRQRLAFMYQMLRQVLSGKEMFGLKSYVTFGELLHSADHQNMLTEIKQAARRTLTKHMKSFYFDGTG